MDGVEETGVTIMFMEAGLDTGPMIAADGDRRSAPDEDAGALVARLSQMGGPLLVAALDDLEAGRPRRRPQPDEGVSLAPKITAEDRVLDLARPAAELARRVRALSPHIGAVARIGGEPFKIWATPGAARGRPRGPVGRRRPARRRNAARGRSRSSSCSPPGVDVWTPPPSCAAGGVRSSGGVPDDRGRRWPSRGSRASAASRCACCAAWRRAPTPTGPWRPRSGGPSSTRGRAPRRRAWPTGPCSGAVRSTGSSTARSTGPPRLEPAVRDILRLGAYEIAFSDGVPDHAAVDQAVRQARSLRGTKTRSSARAGVVNAVMRRIAADSPARLAELESGGVATAALQHSMPDWIADRLVASLGAQDAVEVMRAAAESAESAVRWNPLRGPRAGLEAELPEGWTTDPRMPRGLRRCPAPSRWRSRPPGRAAW